MKKQIGPKKIVIPEQRFYSCYGCDYHTNKLVVSGKNPRRADNCTHPEFPNKVSEMFGNLSKDKDDHVKTPSCCPFIKAKAEKDTAGTFGHGSSGQFMRTQIDFNGRK